MILEEQSDAPSSQSVTLQMDTKVPDAHQITDLDGSDLQRHADQNDDYFIANVRLLISSIIEAPSNASFHKT